MPDISLLEPEVLLGVVRRLVPDQSLILLNQVTKRPSDTSFFTWDVVRGTRTMASPNVPNSEAHVVPRQGRASQSANLLYVREKKVFKPTTLRWLKAVGSNAAQNAEQAVMDDVTDLNNRVDTFFEWMLWQALQGTVTIDSPDVKGSVDYMFAASHKVTASTSWTTATPPEIIGNLKAWKQVVRQDGLTTDATQVYARSETLDLIVSSFAANGSSLMSDRMKDSYFATGTLTGFMGMTWTPVDNTYGIRQSDGTETAVDFLPVGTLLLGNYSQNNPLELVVGPSADDEAPDGHTGRFAKTWKEKDPSARQCLIEDSALPVIYRPEQMMVATVTS